MRKNLIFSILAIMGTIIVLITYLSVFGVKTKNFNDLITSKIKLFDPNLSLNIKDVFLKLDFKEKSININTKNSKLYVDKEFISLSNINLSLDLLNFLKKENSVKKIEIETKKNKIKQITDFLNSYKFSIPRLIIYNQIKDGNIKATVNIIFNKNNSRNFTYNIKAKISEAKLKILNETIIEDIYFDVSINDKKYIIENANFINEGIKFNSKKILIEKLNDKYEIEGDIKSNKGFLDSNYILNIFNKNIDFLDKGKILAETNNKFKFKINSKNKLKDLNLNSEIKFKKIFIKKKIQNLIYFRDGIINIKYNKNNLNIDLNSGYSYLNNNYENSSEDNIKINISKKKNIDYNVEAFVKNKNNTINSKELSNYLSVENKVINNQDINFSSINNISFNINNKYEIKNLSIKSKLNLEKLLVKYESSRLKKIFPEYKDIIKIKDNLIKIDLSKNKIKINTNGNYSFENGYDKFNFEILKNKNNLNFESKIEIVTNSFLLQEINFNKKKNSYAKVELKGKLFKDKKIKFDNVNFSENKNSILLSNLHVSNKYKIIDFEKIKLKYLNNDKKLNQLNIFKKNNKIDLVSENFDGQSIVKNLLVGDSKKNFLTIFENLNSEIGLKFDNFFINDKDYLNKIVGNFVISSNKIKVGDLSAKLNDKNDFLLKIKTNLNNEKITNLFIDNPEPFIKNYKFIKGFNKGNLSYSSIEKNNINNSNLKIYNFKVKEVPVLAKILTLASLQGIADLLTGEGIRFDDFEMDYQSSKTSTRINELYAIGPAISILMDGYIEKEKITSLRGTLVPATTINKTISKIPLIGEILVGKKVGEGVFGVSFKIKGTPNNLKTTVNPIKTLTPRFITRTLDKLKK